MSHRRLTVWLVVLGLVAAACSSSGEGPEATGDVEAVEQTPDDTDTPEPTESEPADEEPAGDEPADEPADDTAPVSGGTLTYGIISDGTGFSTTAAFGEGAIRIIGALTEGLVSIDENGDWRPLLAESVTPNEDATVWTIVIRDGITFHDGVPFDAEAVKANLDAQKASPTVGFVLAPVDEVVVVDPLTVEVRMNTPWGAFPYVFVGQPGWMVSPETIGQNDTFVGVGPFMLESWTPGDSAVTVRNPNYWRADEGLPYLDSVVFKAIPNQAARRQALEAGDIHAFYAPADTDILEFQQGDEVDVYINDGASNEILFLLNTTTPPTDDVRIRRAMAHATDQQLLIDTFRSGLTIPAKSFVAPTSPWWVDTDYPQFDLDAAIALVDEYEAEVGPAEVTFTASNISSVVEFVEFVATFWEDAGIDVTIDTIQAGTEVPVVVGDSFQVIFWAQFSSVDPDGQYVFFHSSGGLINWTNLVSEDMDEGFDIGRSSLDPAVRAEGYAQVQQVFADEVPVIWIDHLGGVEGVAADPSVHGIDRSVFPDGTPGYGFLGGSFFSWEDVWIG